MPDGRMRSSQRFVQNEDGTYSRNLSSSSTVDATEGAKAAAEELGVDLSTVEGSGKEGRVTKADVEHASA